MRTGILSILLLVPWVSNAAVIISEIAWMGTTVGPNEEWIELYNDGSASVGVDGWTLTDAGSFSIALQGNIPAHAYVLLERSDDETVPTIAAFQIYTGALSNTGTTLSLRDSNGTIMDTVIGGENWENIGGDNVTKDTPQLGTNGWFTDTATPGRQNQITGNEDEDDESAGSVKGITTTKKDDGPGVYISLAPSMNELQLSIAAPEVVYVNQSVTFGGVAHGIGPNLLNSLSYTWNFGDTYTETGKGVSHTYKFPGEYPVVLNGTVARHDVTVQKLIQVLPVTLTLTRTLSGDLVVKNLADHDIDLSGYVLRGTNTLIFPRNSLLMSGGSLTLEKKRFEVVPSIVVLKDTEGAVVASETYMASSVSAPLPIVTKAPSNLRTPVQAEPREGDESNISITTDIGQRMATSSLAALTIPVYASESSEVHEQNSATTRLLPFFGLAALMVFGTLFLYRRRDTIE